jgi:hypothetical protein
MANAAERRSICSVSIGCSSTRSNSAFVSEPRVSQIELGTAVVPTSRMVIGDINGKGGLLGREVTLYLEDGETSDARGIRRRKTDRAGRRRDPRWHLQLDAAAIKSVAVEAVSVVELTTCVETTVIASSASLPTHRSTSGTCRG